MNTIRRLLTITSLIAAIGLVGCGAVNQLWVQCPGYTGVSAPRWLPDSTRISYIIEEQYANSSLYLANVTEGTTSKLGDVPDYLSLAWSPDASHLLAIKGDTLNENEFFFLDLEDWQKTVVEDITALPDSVQWSPDGQQIAITFYTFDLLILSSEGEIIWKLSDRYGDEILPSGVSWSPDGKYLAFNHHIEDQQYLGVVEANGNNLQLFPLTEKFVEPFTWSPDGQWLAFHSTETHLTVNIMRPDGTDIRLLASETARPFVWLPDGSGLIYLNAAGEVKTVSTEGVSQTIRASESPNPDYGAFEFSPDASKVAYMVRGKLGGYDLYVMNVDGTDKRQITHNPGNSMCFNWPF